MILASTKKGTAVAAFPDVCKTPTPGGPVPIPYPSLGGTNNQLSKLKMDGTAVMSKGAKYLKSTGDEAGTAMGVKTHTVTGAPRVVMHSFDVKAEGKKVAHVGTSMLHNSSRVTQLRSRLQSITAQLVGLTGKDPNVWHDLVDEYVLVTAELYLELTSS